MNKGAILIQDLLGHKTPTGLVGQVRGLFKAGGEPVNVFRGQLVVPLTEQHEDGAPTPKGGDKKLYPYCLLEDSAVTVFCNEQDVAPLDSTEFQLMEGIKSREDRYEVFLSGDRLDWGNRLKRGDHVLATLPSSNPCSQTRVVVVIQYVGELPQETGIQFGVEIVDEEFRGQGATDGIFQGKVLFHCEDNCGLFLGLEKIHPLPQARGHAAHGHQQGQLGSPHSDVTVDQPPAVKKGDRVVVHNKKGVACLGTVRWIGRNTTSRKFEFPIAGIFMENKVSNVEFEGSIPDMSHLVSGPKHHTLFLPASLVSVVQGKRVQGDVEQSVTTTNLAKAMNMSRQELIKQQKKILKEVNENKDVAAADPEFDVEKQREAFRMFEKEKPQPATQAPPQLPPKGVGLAGREGRPQRDRAIPPGQLSAGGSRVRRQPSYEPIPGPREEDQSGSQHLPPPSRAPNGSSGGVADVHRGAGLARADSSQSHHQPATHSPAVRSDLPPVFSTPTYTDPYHGEQQPQPRYTEGAVSQSQFPPMSQIQAPPSAVVPPDTNIIVPSPHPTVDPRLEEESMVEVTTTAAPRYGVIKWIGNLPNVPYRVAGVELEDDLDGCTDGTWQGTGQRFFQCPPGRGFFCPLHSLKPDTRFGQPESHQPGAAVTAFENPLMHIPLEEEADQGFGQTTIPSVEKYAKPERGIQGHQNSCYLDATVFGLFALSDVFDSLFLEKSADEIEESIKNTLWRGIVNPLRKNGTVRYESVMRLREQLDRLGKMKGIAQDEKDPEEFLNMLFKHTLHVQPFITIQRPQGEEGEFFVQLFMEPFEGPRLPTIEDLLRRMFKDQKIKFAQVPSKLLIQVPRYGKQFKAFEKIIPNLRLNIEDLCASSADVKSLNTALLSMCFICNAEARVRCTTCKSEFNCKGDSVHFCEECSEKVHSVPWRANHATERDAVVELELLSVICIETSHYVCFTHYEGHWVFMDSMADRMYNTYNIPKGVDVTRDLKEWVYSGEEDRLKQTPVRKLPEYVRRFTQDIYMCVYIQPDYGMYQ